MTNQKKWYLKDKYSRANFNKILNRIKKLLFSISILDEVKINTYKKLGKIGDILLELEFTEIENDS